MKKINEKFLAIADAVSFGMGTPTNILFWILAVAIWIFLGAFRQDWFIDGNFLPEWFTSTAWNFPLNTVTTLAELYIGFLVAAAANRAERELRKLIEGVKRSLEKQDQILEMLVKYQEKEIAKENQVLEALKKKA